MLVPKSERTQELIGDILELLDRCTLWSYRASDLPHRDQPRALRSPHPTHPFIHHLGNRHWAAAGHQGIPSLEKLPPSCGLLLFPLLHSSAAAVTSQAHSSLRRSPHELRTHHSAAPELSTSAQCFPNQETVSIQLTNMFHVFKMCQALLSVLGVQQ